jgi:hypothetical protein
MFEAEPSNARGGAPRNKSSALARGAPRDLPSSIPPHNLQMERAILGCAILEAHSRLKLAEILNPTDFFKDAHRIIFTAMSALLDRGQPVDLVTLAQELRRRNELDLVGGEDALAALMEEAATSTNAFAYAKVVGEEAARRRLIACFAEAAKKCGDPRTDVAALLTQIGEEAAKAASSFRSLKDGVGKETNFQPVKAADLLAREPEAVRWVWDPYIPEGTLVLLSAFMKVGKSFLSQALVVSVARGDEFLGFRTTPSHVLILALEEHPEDVKRRLRRFNMRPEDPIYVHAGRLDGTLATLGRIRAFIIDHGIKLVIVDTLGRYWDIKDENDNAEVTRAVSPLLDLARETGAAVVLIHHERKAGGEEGRAIRGASALLGLVDQALSLDRRQGGKQVNQRVLRALGRYDETPRELVIELAGNTYQKLGTPAELGLKAAKELLWKALSEEVSQDVDELAAKTLLRPNAVRRALAAIPGVVHDGGGKKGDPFKYRLPTPDSIQPQADPMGEEETKPVAKRTALRTSHASDDRSLEAVEEEWS